MSKNLAVILAAGYGTRLNTVVTDRPKPMVLINHKPFLFYLLNYISSFGIKRFVICVSHLKTIIKDFFKNGRQFGYEIVYSEEKDPSGTAGALVKAEKFIDTPFFCFNGDTFLETNLHKLKDFHNLNQALATVCLTKINDVYEKGQVRLNDNKKLISFTEKKPVHKSGWVNGGVYFFNKDIYDYFPRIKDRDLIKGREYSLEYHVFPEIIKKNLAVYGYKTEGKFIDIGTPDDYKKVQTFFT
jgi:D-glycero-alpha-D-manno-heptose 1-phosphate guanylyltransferase